MSQVLLFLILLLGPRGSALAAVPAGLGAGDTAAARVLLAELAEHIPPQALTGRGVSCQDLRPEGLPGFAQLPSSPRALARAALALALSGAACKPQAEAEVLGLAQELGPAPAAALLRGLARLRAAPAPEALPLLLSLVRPQGSAPAWRCTPSRQGPAAGTHPTPPGPPATAPLAKGVRVLPGARARAWLSACRHTARHRHRREDEGACNPPGERAAHGVLEWVPGVSTFYNLGTSIYYAFQGCEALASSRALEVAEDLGYASLAALAAGAGGPVALGLQVGVKAGVRALLGYFASDRDPPPAPAAPAPPPSSS
ncbi:APOF protein, partial [Podilymbus podiceps]|nr:APOF protein [Podilymbus podiceps]